MLSCLFPYLVVSIDHLNWGSNLQPLTCNHIEVQSRFYERISINLVQPGMAKDIQAVNSLYTVHLYLRPCKAHKPHPQHA